jgi:hypothetical protein
MTREDELEDELAAAVKEPAAAGEGGRVRDGAE